MFPSPGSPDMTRKGDDGWAGQVWRYILAFTYVEASVRKTQLLKDFPLYLELTRLLTTIQRLLTSERPGIFL